MDDSSWDQSHEMAEPQIGLLELQSLFPDYQSFYPTIHPLLNPLSNIFCQSPLNFPDANCIRCATCGSSNWQTSQNNHPTSYDSSNNLRPPFTNDIEGNLQANQMWTPSRPREGPVIVDLNTSVQLPSDLPPLVAENINTFQDESNQPQRNQALLFSDAVLDAQFHNALGTSNSESPNYYMSVPDTSEVPLHLLEIPGGLSELLPDPAPNPLDALPPPQFDNIYSTRNAVASYTDIDLALVSPSSLPHSSADSSILKSQTSRRAKAVPIPRLSSAPVPTLRFSFWTTNKTNL